MQVEPRFHDDASNLEQLVPFEECIELHSSGKEVVKAPDYLLLTNNGRSFKLVSVTFFTYVIFLKFLQAMSSYVCLLSLSLSHTPMTCFQPGSRFDRVCGTKMGMENVTCHGMKYSRGRFFWVILIRNTFIRNVVC